MQLKINKYKAEHIQYMQLYNILHEIALSKLSKLLLTLHIIKNTFVARIAVTVRIIKI